MPKNVVVIGALIILTVIFSAFVVYKIEYEFYKNIYNNDVDSTVSLITKKIQSVSSAAETTAAFFSLKGDVSQKQFNDFAEVVTRNISSGNAMPTMIEWADTNNVIKYVYPSDDSNQQVMGLDLNKYSNRLTPMIKARDTKSTIFSDPIMFIEGYPGILVYSPIFRDSKYEGQIIIAIGLFNILDLSTKEKTAKNENIYLRTENFFVPFYKNTIFNNNGERILNAQGESKKDLEAQKYYLKPNKLVSKEIIFSDKKWQINFSPTYITETYKMAIIYTIVAFVFVLEVIAFIWFIVPIKSKRR